MTDLNMKQFLENVISGKSNRRFATMDGKNSVHIPLLVRSKQPKTLFMYSTNYNDIAASDKNNTNPVRIQLQNLVKGAMIYSVFQQLGKDEPLAQKLNSSINAFFNGRGQQKRFSSELETEVNEAWRKAIESDEANLITKNARLMIDTAIEEMNAGGDLKAAKVSISDAKSAADLFVKSFEVNIMHSANTPLTRNNEISAMFSNTGEKVQEFINQRFGSTFDQHYLRMLLVDNANALQHLGDKINIDMSVIAADIPFRQENESQSPTNSIPSSVYRKARVNNKKGVRGKISAYIKRDESFGEYGLSHLIVNVTEHDGAEHVNYNEFLFSHTSNPLDGSSTNELTAYLKTENEVQPYFTPERALQHLEEEKLSAERRAAFEAQVIEENAVKRAEAFSVYNTLQDVTNAEQLQDTYFGKANVAELAVKYIHGLKVSPEGNVWLPLANVIENKPVEENIEAFQELLANKPEWSSTNKLFQGLGDGYKHKCSVTLGDPKTASIIGTSEGVKNGLIQMEMAKQRGIELAIVCALDVGNLTSAVKKIIDEHPTKPIVNFADNDLFNSDQQRRFLRHELEAQGIEPNGKNTNIGMDKAIEIHQAVNLPYIAYDFESDVEGMNLLNFQQSQKGSDIDDLLNAVQQELANNGVEDSQQEAWRRVTDLFENKIESTMKFSVSPHWTKERQKDFGWCPSLENLSEQRLPNYYHMKESIGHAQEVFQKNYGMKYDVYQSMVQTRHWSPSSEEMASMVVADDTIEQYEDAITQHIENIENGVVEVNENSIESEPMTELDAQLGSLISPTIDEKVNKVDAKITSLTRRIHNLEQNMDKYPIAKFEERMEVNSTALDRLYDEKARLLGVSANQIKRERSLNKYYDRSITESNDPLVINQGKENLQFESLENAQSADVKEVDSQSLLNDVFKQVYDNDDSPSNNNQGIVDLLHAWAEDQKAELDALLESPHDDVNKQFSAFSIGIAELEQHLTGIEDNSESLVSGSLKTSTEYSKYFVHLEALKQQADETLNVNFDEQARAAIDSLNIQPEPDWTPSNNDWADGLMMDASQHEMAMNESFDGQHYDTDNFAHFFDSDTEQPEAVTPEHEVAEHAEAPESEPEQPEAVTPEHDVAEHAEAPESEPDQPEAVTPEHDVAEHAEAPESEPDQPEAVTPEHDVAEHAEAPESEPDQPEAVTPEHEVAEHAEAPESEPEQPEAVTPEHDVAEHAEAP
ncbi:hypothetical protein, partial [Vibrio sp. TRT 29B02]|uniref:hypothetical protein n=1 Tax=Vibrio sp. TRT 29B02 TaxID=3418508 RepID=UPI003CF19CAC